jgi:hypothetical protein
VNDTEQNGRANAEPVNKFSKRNITA